MVEARIARWLSVRDGPSAVDYYKAAFGAVERYRLEDDDSHRVVVAQLAIGQADLRQAMAAGATEIAPVSEDPGWRIGRLADPFGHHWEVGKPLSPAPG